MGRQEKPRSALRSGKPNLLSHPAGPRLSALLGEQPLVECCGLFWLSEIPRVLGEEHT